MDVPRCEPQTGGWPSHPIVCGDRTQVNPGAPWLMLRSALEARWSCVRSALRPLADAEWTFRELALGTRLCAGRGGTGGEGARVAGQETDSRNRRKRVEEREYSRTARRAGC